MLVARHAAAEALVTLGLLRRRRVGPSRPFLWLLGMALVIVAAAAADIDRDRRGDRRCSPRPPLRLIVYYRRASRQEREGGTYIGPGRHSPAGADGSTV